MEGYLFAMKFQLTEPHPPILPCLAVRPFYNENSICVVKKHSGFYFLGHWIPFNIDTALTGKTASWERKVFSLGKPSMKWDK